jgi:hypothetical protein
MRVGGSMQEPKTETTGWEVDLVRVLRACQAICRQLAEEALMRLGAEREGRPSALPAERQAWLLAEREKLERLLEMLGDPL